MKGRKIYLKTLLGWVILPLFSCQLAMGEVLTLDSCLSYARQRNCTIKSALVDVQIAQQVKKQVFTKYFPQVNVTAFGFYSIDPIIKFHVFDLIKTDEIRELAQEIIDDMNNGHDAKITDEIDLMNWGVSAGASVVQPVFMGGRIVTGNKLAKLGIEAAEKKMEVSERDVLQEVEDTYWLIVGLYEKRATIQAVENLLDTIGQVADLAFNNGLVTGNDKLKVELKRNEIATLSTRLNDGIVLASKLLCQLTGQTYEGELELEPFPEEEAIDAYMLVDDINISGRPETELLEMNIKAEQLRKKMTIGEALPQVGIGLQGGYSNFFNHNRWNGMAFAFVRIPITQWWETGHKIKEHNLRIEKAKMMQEDLTGKMSLQNEQVYSQLNEAVRLVIQQESSVKMAEDNYRISLMNYEAGLTTMSELLESQALLLQAKNAHTDALISLRGAQRKFSNLNK